VVTAALGVYVTAAIFAFWRTDAHWPTRLALAVLWPLGPAAFVVTVLILLAASAIAFPVVGAIVAGALVLAWALVRL
jgi:hypothetical protein